MNSTDIIGYAIDGDIYCPECVHFDKYPDRDLADPIFCGDEFDYIPHCGDCGAILEGYGLTGEGVLSALEETGVEVFEVTPQELFNTPDHFAHGDDMGPGWYAWICSPGCLPDGDPIGPFPDSETAIEEAADYYLF